MTNIGYGFFLGHREIRDYIVVYAMKLRPQHEAVLTLVVVGNVAHAYRRFQDLPQVGGRTT